MEKSYDFYYRLQDREEYQVQIVILRLLTKFRVKFCYFSKYEMRIL